MVPGVIVKGGAGAHELENRYKGNSIAGADPTPSAMLGIKKPSVFSQKGFLLASHRLDVHGNFRLGDLRLPLQQIGHRFRPFVLHFRQSM